MCETKKLKTENDRTPEGMEGLQWEEEIDGKYEPNVDDEWSRLYLYYAQSFEKNGDLLADTVNIKDPHCLDSYYYAPIHYAAITGNLNSMRILINHNSPIDITTHTGASSLYLGITHIDIVRLLLSFRANPNKSNYHNLETPLHAACRVGTVEVVYFLFTIN